MDEAPADEAAKIVSIRQILQEHVIGKNLTTLRVLFKFISEVGGFHEATGMTVANLAIVFGPNLIWAKGAGPDSGKIPQLSHLKHVSDFLEFLINNVEDIWTGIEKEGYKPVAR
jgi:Rho GTPase-activating protein 1